MPDIVRELTIAAAPQRVWDALTQPEEIGHWWTNESLCHPGGRLSCRVSLWRVGRVCSPV